MNDSIGNLTSSEAHSHPSLSTHGATASGVRIGVLCFNLLSGVPAYSCVVWHIVRNNVASEFFNLNLNVCEIFFSLTSVAFVLSQWFPSLILLQRLSLGLAITGRPLFQCLICVERYLAVVHPMTFLKYKALRHKIVCSVLVWLIAFGSCLFCMFSFVPYYIHVFTWSTLLQFLVFLFIQLFCCVAVLRALKQSGPGERGREREEENRMKKRAFYLILIITVSMIITYAPFAVTGFVYILTQLDVAIFWPVCFSCFILGGFVQPVLYLKRTGKCFCFNSI